MQSLFVEFMVNARARVRLCRFLAALWVCGCVRVAGRVCMRSVGIVRAYESPALFVRERAAILLQRARAMRACERGFPSAHGGGACIPGEHAWARCTLSSVYSDKISTTSLLRSRRAASATLVLVRREEDF